MQDEDFRVTVPPGACGEWTIDRFEVTADAPPQGDRGPSDPLHVPPGTYTRLTGPMAAGGTFGFNVWMSDVPHEIGGHREIVRRACGRVLITGLGLGMVVQACLRKPEVQHVTVIEAEPEVIALAGEHYLQAFGDRLTIVQADAYRWRPPAGTLPWDTIWHDVWPTIDPENVRAMNRLRRHFAPWCTGWQGCWEEATCRAMRQVQRQRARARAAGRMQPDGTMPPDDWERVKENLSRELAQLAAASRSNAGKDESAEISPV